MVTTARITHATPAAAYASSAHRDWEDDSNIPTSESGCKDIARQLVEDNGYIRVSLKVSECPYGISVGKSRIKSIIIILLTGKIHKKM